MSLTEIASKALSPERLKEFFDCIIHKRWNVSSNKNIQKYIILQSYCSLWSGDEAIMHKYFFKEAHELAELKQFLKTHDLYGPKHGPRSVRDQHYSPDSNVEDILPEYRESQRGNQCGHSFKKGESVYRCKGCSADDTCVMCSKCFHSTNHEGHQVKISISTGGGCCDCGDPEAWIVPLNCSIHSYSNTPSRQTLQPRSSVPPEVIQSIRDTIRVVFNFILETFATVPEDISKLGTFESIKKRCKEAHAAHGLPVDDPEQEYCCMLWNDEKHSFDIVNNVLSVALNLVKTDSQRVAEIVDEFGRHTVTIGKSLHDLIATFSRFEVVSLGVSITTQQLNTREYISFILLHWLKDITSGQCHFFDDVEDGNCIMRDIICEVLAEDWELSPELARFSTLYRRKRQLKDDSSYSNDDDDNDHNIVEDTEVADIWENESDIGLVGIFEDTNNNSDEEYPEVLDHDFVNSDEDEGEGDEDGDIDEDAGRFLLQVASDLNSLIPVITNENREVNEPIRKLSLSSAEESNKNDILDMRDDLELWIDYTKKIETEEREITEKGGCPVQETSKESTATLMKKEFYRKTRLDYFLQFDQRLWKSVRNYIKDILINTFISSLKYRPILGIRFERNYPELIDALLFKDREPDLSINNISVQLLTVPTVASILVKDYNFFGMVCTILKNYFPTNQISMNVSLDFRPHQIDCLGKTVIRQSVVHVLYHLRYIMSADPVKEEISKNPVYLQYLLDLLHQFQEMDPLLRQLDTHIEFESRSWITAFGLTLQLVKLCGTFADSFGPSQIPTIDASRNLKRSISRILKEITKWEQVLKPQKSENHRTPVKMKGFKELKFKEVSTYNTGPRYIVDYDITKEAISFHHPFHWLLSKLFQQTPLLDPQVSLKEMIQNALVEDLALLHTDTSSNNMKVTHFESQVLEPPIRILATIAQINCGVWVRNGYAIRNQALSYKEAYLREFTWDADVLLLQVGLTVCDNDRILLTLMDRFQVLDWFKGDLSRHRCYDHTQYIYIVEEFLNLLIICATEHSYVTGAAIEERIRYSIIQYLGLSSKSHSELMKALPDSLSEHASFDQLLYQVSNYKAPEGLTDKGLYELKPEYVDEINPYFWHYTRNQQEASHIAIKKIWNQRHPGQKVKDNEEFLMIPKTNNIKSGPFKELGSFLHSHVFCQILAYSLWNYREYKTDTVLDLALYLAMVSILDTNDYSLKKTDPAASNHLIDLLDKDTFPVEQGKSLTLLDIFLQSLDDQNFSHTHKRLCFIIDTIESKGSEKIKQTIAQWRNIKVNSASSVDTLADEKASDYQKKKAAAKARQAAIMSQFANAQSKFLEQHADDYNSEVDESMEEDYGDEDTTDLNNGLEIVRKCQFTADTCIVCQEDLDDSQLYGMLGYIQASNTKRLAYLDDPGVLANILKASASEHPWGNSVESSAPFIGFSKDAHVTGLDITSCGHQIHAPCFDTFKRSNTSNRLPLLDELNIAPPFTSSSQAQFLCPLCKSLGNVLVPVVWSGKKETFPGVMAPSTPYSQVCDLIRDVALDLKKSFESNPDLIDDQHPFVNLNPYLVIKDKEKLRFLYNQLMRATGTVMDVSASEAVLNLPLSLKNLYNMYATTISNLEIAQRGEDSRPRDLTIENTGTYIDNVSRSSQLLLKILSLTNNLIPNLMNNSWQAEDRFTKERLALQAINQFMPETVTHLIEDMVEADNLKPLLMEDSFQAFVRFSFALHEMPTIDIHHILRSMYIAELTKIVIAIASNVTSSILKNDHAFKKQDIRQLLQSLNSTSDGTVRQQDIHRFTTDILECLKFPQNAIDYFFQIVQPGALVSLARTFVCPFLRKSLLFMVVHHGFIPQSPISETSNELDRLLSTLNLPSFDKIFDLQNHEKELITNWCRHYIDASDITNTNSYYKEWRPISLDLPTKYELVTLPYCIDDLLDESVKRKCSKCKSVPEKSAICLICGTFVCPRNFCCIEDDKGECNSHMKGCGGDIGIYLMVEQCFLLFLHADGGHIMNAPYLDSHGEADLFFRRGARQYLNQKRYEQIRQLWLSQAIPSFVRRKMDDTYNSTLWESF